MQQRPLGNSSILITPVIFGCWQAGKSQWVGIDDEESIAAIRSAYDAGITTFDTAEGYGGGHSEQILAKALADKREDIQILDKVAAHNLAPERLLAACNRSLTNLGTDYIDLYQIHWPSGTFNSPVVPIVDSITALQSLKESGKIRAYGVSNFSHAQLLEAAEYGRIDTVQPPYSLFWRQGADPLAAYCVEQQISIIAYSPLAQGLLTGKFGKDHVFEQGDVRNANKLFKGENFVRALAALDQLKPFAKKYNVTLGQLAIAWLIAQPQTSAIVGARTSDQATQNAAAGGISLSKEDVATIDKIGRTVTDHLDSNPIMWE